jgi:putative addiction module component (TIGR02574 family)
VFYTSAGFKDMTMAQTLPIPPAGFDELTIDEKLDYIQSLWDRVTAGPEDIPVPEWHWRILDERLEAYRANPEEGRPWQEVYEDLQRKLQDRRRER